MPHRHGTSTCSTEAFQNLHQGQGREDNFCRARPVFNMPSVSEKMTVNIQNSTTDRMVKGRKHCLICSPNQLL